MNQLQFTLRDFQKQLVCDILDAYSRTDSVLACSPTGSGKTVMMSHIVRGLVSSGHFPLIVCHRETLITQTSEKLHAYGVPHGMIGGGYNRGSYEPVIVGTVQSVVRRRFSRTSWLIFDEAHLSRAASWETVRSHYPNARLLGFSATPTRLSGEGFEGMYGELVMGPSVAKLIEGGYLAPYRAFAPSVPDLAGIHNVGGDWNQGELSTVMQGTRLVGDIVDNWRQHCSDRRTLVFCVNRKHAERMAEEFRVAGVSAENIDGSISKGKQRELLARFGRDIQVLTSVQLFTEGFDRPDIDCLILARPTQSLALHLQMIGRGLRTHPGKVNCLVMDHSGNLLRHGCVRNP